MNSSNDLEQKVKDFLQILVNDSKLQKLYTFSILEPEKVEKDLLISILREPFIIEYDEEDGRLYYINDEGEKVLCPDIETGVSTCRDWISDSLPPVPFDVEQNGNIRKANESENIYKSLLIAGILQGDFLEEFKNIVSHYDFDNLKSKDENICSFTELVAKWQSLQNITIRILVSGANLKISSEKKSEAGFAIGTLNREETIGVVSIRTRVKNIIRSYMEDKLLPSNVKKLSKIDRLIAIQEKDNAVLKEINKSLKFSELYKICSMDADYLDASVKNKLTNSATSFARNEALTFFADDEPGYKKFISTCRRRAYKESLIALKESEIVKWRSVGNSSYKLPSKR